MVKRRGVSLVNVMVFMVFAVMLTAQVFFFAKNAVDDVADEREMMMYRMNLDSLVEEAKEELRDTGKILPRIPTLLTVDKFIVWKYSEFYEKTKVWEKSYDIFTVTIHDLNFVFAPSIFTSFNKTEWKKQSGSNMYKKVFAAFPRWKIELDALGNPISLITDILDDGTLDIYQYYLIRAWVQLPENFYNMRLMYQVLVNRHKTNHNNLKTLSFQEIWFPEKDGNE